MKSGEGRTGLHKRAQLCRSDLKGIVKRRKINARMVIGNQPAEKPEQVAAVSSAVFAGSAAS